MGISLATFLQITISLIRWHIPRTDNTLTFSLTHPPKKKKNTLWKRRKFRVVKETQVARSNNRPVPNLTKRLDSSFTVREKDRRMVWSSSSKMRWIFQFGFCVLSLGWASSVSGSFSYEIHHRFSKQVRTVLGGHGLPEMGTLEYYTALVHRDRGRRLTSNNNQTTVSFAQGNSTQEISLYEPKQKKKQILCFAF